MVAPRTNTRPGPEVGPVDVPNPASGAAEFIVHRNRAIRAIRAIRGGVRRLTGSWIAPGIAWPRHEPIRWLILAWRCLAAGLPAWLAALASLQFWRRPGFVQKAVVVSGGLLTSILFGNVLGVSSRLSSIC